VVGRTGCPKKERERERERGEKKARERNGVKEVRGLSGREGRERGE